MKVIHWSERSLNSGLGHTSLNIAEAERVLGINSIVIDAHNEAEWSKSDDADIHVIHLYMPTRRLYRDNKPKIWVAHGTPEVMWEGGIESQATGAYGAADAWQIAQFWLQHADVTITFWPRHEAIWRSLADRHTRIEGVPLGVGSFWQKVPSQGKFVGNPSVFTAENCYAIKRPLDLFVAWPWVVRELPDAKLHAVNIPQDQNRFWFPLVNRNGASYHSYITNRFLPHDELRNAFVSTDYYANLVRYADHNYVGLQASACGAKVISYKGNPYAHFWIDQGDQRVMAGQLGAILRGEVEEREDRQEPVSLMRTAERFKEIYLSLAKDAPTGLVERKPRRIRVPKAKAEVEVATIQ